MKKTTLLWIIALTFPVALFAVPDTRIMLTNATAFDRTNELVEVAISAEVAASVSTLALYNANNEVVPYQLLSGLDSKIVFPATVNAGATTLYMLRAGTPAVSPPLTYAANKIPATRNDIAWENNLSAYRMYSRILLSSEPNTANGVDIWFKKKTEPVIDKMYTYADYHSEKEEGVDAYSVNGKTLGAGGVVAYANNQLWLHDPYDECEIVAAGPLRSEFVLTYRKVEVDGDLYTKTLRVTTNAHGLLNKAVVKFEGRMKPMKVAVGIYLHTNMSNVTPNGVQLTSESNIIGYAENKSEGTLTSANARMYVGVYMPGETTVSTISNQLVIMSDYAVGSEFTYYFGGGWNIFPAGKYATDQSWFDALKQLKQSIANPLETLATRLPSKLDVLAKAEAVNSYWIANNADQGNNLWARAVYHAGNVDFYKVYPKKIYLDYSKQWAVKNSWAVSGGSTTVNADNRTCGQAYIDLYLQDEVKDEAKISAIKANLDYMVSATRADHWWWIDAIFMDMPTFTRLGVLTGDSKYFDKMYQEFNTIKTIGLNKSGVDNSNSSGGLFNTSSSLWWRDWGYKPGAPTKPEPYEPAVNVPKVTANGKNVFWARGNGWVMAGLARTLQLLPETDAHRAEYFSMFFNMAVALRNCQRDDGFWNMNLDDPQDYPGPETSGTALFTYGLAWGISNGLLGYDDFYPTMAKGWNGLCAVAMQPSGQLSLIQNVGEKPIPTNQLASSVDFGVGAFLLAASEVVKLADGTMPQLPVRPISLESVVLQDATHLKVVFDSPLSELSATKTSNYSISSEISVVASALDGTNSVILTLNNALDYGRYSLSVSQVKNDEGGVVNEGASLPFVRTVPLTPFDSSITVTAIGNQAGNPPSNAVDNDLNTRWAQAGFGQWIRFDMGKEVDLWAVDVAFYSGTQRTSYFDVEVSSNNVTYTKVLTGLQTSGITNEMERYAFTPQKAQYLRLWCNSNSTGGENWNSITEVRIPGTAYTVSFTSNGSTLFRQRVMEGDTAITPADPLRQAYVFDQWRYNGAAWNFGTPITADITLVATWIPSYTVSFVSNDSTLLQQQVAEGTPATKPADPVRQGYTFDGWYHNGELWDFSTTVTANIWIEASWIPIINTVIFVSNDSTLSQQQVVEGTPATKPADPVREGYTFDGWFYNGVLWDFGTVVTSDLRLEARWTEVVSGISDQPQLGVMLYPNPFTDEVLLTGAKGCLLQVVNTLGATVHTQKITSASETIRLNHLPIGIYIFRIEKGGKVIRFKDLKI
jgi:uncharacterized repeat protein (TIGR02543 family)